MNKPGQHNTLNEERKGALIYNRTYISILKAPILKQLTRISQPVDCEPLRSLEKRYSDYNS